MIGNVWMVMTGVAVALAFAGENVKAAADSAAVTAPVSATADTLVVTCRLTGIPGKFVANDLYDYVYIMKYRILSVEKGSCSEKELLVGHYNPLIARNMVRDKMDSLVDGTVAKFTVGAKHRLTLIAPIDDVWDGAVEDEYIDVEQTKYYALKADLVP
jgi:hypothetical protein